MQDRNGKEITIGATAVHLPRDKDPAMLGRIGTVRGFSEGHWKGTKNFTGPLCRVSEGPEGDYEWSAWCSSEEVVIV